MADETAKLPDTECYRVVIAGARYDAPRIDHDLEGNARVIYVSEFALRGQEIELIPREVKRLTELGAVRPADSQREYDELGDDELAALAASRGVPVRSTGADADKPLREDYINALVVYDRGAGDAVGAGTQPGGIAVQGVGGPQRVPDEVATPGPAEDQASLTAPQLREQIDSEGLTAPQTIDLAQDDPALAQRVLEAERLSGDPRTSVEKGLQKIIDG
jgi:HPt (histidine-containing phosphotransfer) domain-containing protein